MTIPSWCYRGAKIVRLTDSPTLKAGTVCVVDRLVPFRDCEGFAGVWLVGHRSHGKIGAYRLDQFRPLVSLEDDLEAHFNQFLTTDHRERV